MKEYNPRETYMKTVCINCDGNKDCTTAFLDYPLDICDKYVEYLEEQNKQMSEVKEKYNELIMSVESKNPNETRHQTALRYIQEREHHSNLMAGKKIEEESLGDISIDDLIGGNS